MIEFEPIQPPKEGPGAKDGSIILAWLVPAGAKSKANIKLFPPFFFNKKKKNHGGGVAQKDLTGEIKRESTEGLKGIEYMRLKVQKDLES